MVDLELYEKVMIWQSNTILVLTWNSFIIPTGSRVSKMRGVAFGIEWKMSECMESEWEQ